MRSFIVVTASAPLPRTAWHNHDLACTLAPQVDSAAATAEVTLKDEQGQVIQDQLNPALICARVIGP